MHDIRDFPGTAGGFFHCLERTDDFNLIEALDLVTDVDVVVILDADTALGAGFDFVDIVLEAAQ
jgi:hypothetical protein